MGCADSQLVVSTLFLSEHIHFLIEILSMSLRVKHCQRQRLALTCCKSARNALARVKAGIFSCFPVHCTCTPSRYVDILCVLPEIESLLALRSTFHTFIRVLRVWHGIYQDDYPYDFMSISAEQIQMG